MIKLISFDLGGTLYCTKTKKIHKIHELAESINVDEEELRRFLKPILYSQKNSKQQIVELVNKEFGVDCKDCIDRIYTNNKKSCLYKGVKFVLEKLIESGYELAILSNQNCLINYSDSEISKYFKYTIYSCDIGYCKPNKEIFEILCQKSGFKPNEILHVGDNYNSDYLGAKHVGMNVFLVDREGLFKDVQNTIKSLKGLLNWLKKNNDFKLK